MVLHLPGDLIGTPAFEKTLDDVTLMSLLGVKIVIVCGIAHQVRTPSLPPSRPPSLPPCFPLALSSVNEYQLNTPFLPPSLRSIVVCVMWIQRRSTAET